MFWKVGKIRILFLNRWVGCHIGGTETHIKELASRLAKRGHEVHILTTQGDELKKYEGLIKVWYVSKNRGEPLYSRSMSHDSRLPFYALMFTLKALAKLLYLRLKGVKYDVISTHYALEAAMLRYLRLFLHVRYLFVFEGYTDLEAKIAKHANLQVSISKAIADKCHEKYNYRPVVLPVGIDRTRFKPDGTKIPLNRSVYKWVVLSVCRLDPKKNLSTLVEAARIVCSRDPSFLFLLVGKGREKEKLEKLAEKHGLHGNVVLTGGISDDELPAYYRSADIFASTEVTPDEFLITAIEAMTSGLAVIVTSPTGTFEAIGDSGIVISPNRPDVVAKKILEIAYDNELRGKLVEKSLKKAEEYDWELLIRKYEKAYVSVAQKKNKHLYGL